MNKVIVILGPTAVGKTKLSIALAKELNGEIINADSTQVYKGLDVATAKVTKEEMEGVTHHLLSFVELEDTYTVYDYQRDCRILIDDILRRGKTPILVGGTGLYIKAALYDYHFEEEKAFSKEDERTTEELYEALAKIDPDTDIHPHNRKRILRALAYYEQHASPLSAKEKASKLLYDTLFIGLTTDRTVLYEKIDGRVGGMLQDGLLEEAKALYNTNNRGKSIMTPIGYKELFPYFDKQNSLEESLDQIRRNSRRYAKRQYTFFNHQLPVVWFDTCYDHFDKTIIDVVSYIKGA